MPSQVEPGRNGQSRAEPSHDEPRQADTSPVRADAFWNSGVPYIFVFSLRLFRPFSKGLVTSINQTGPYALRVFAWFFAGVLGRPGPGPDRLGLKCYLAWGGTRVVGGGGGKG